MIALSRWEGLTPSPPPSVLDGQHASRSISNVFNSPSARSRLKTGRTPIFACSDGGRRALGLGGRHASLIGPGTLNLAGRTAGLSGHFITNLSLTPHSKIDDLLPWAYPPRHSQTRA